MFESGINIFLNMGVMQNPEKGIDAHSLIPLSEKFCVYQSQASRATQHWCLCKAGQWKSSTHQDVSIRGNITEP